MRSFAKNVLLSAAAAIVLLDPASLLADAFALTTNATAFDSARAGSPLEVAWVDADGPVKITLVSTGQEIPVAAGLVMSPYTWTPSFNLSGGLYTLKINDSSGDGDMRTFRLSSAAPSTTGSSSSTSTRGSGPGRTPPSGKNNGTMDGPFATTDDGEGDDNDDDDVPPMVPRPGDGAFPRAAIIGIAIGGACALGLIILFAIGTWSFRQKYLDVMRRHGDLLREVLGDAGRSGNGAGGGHEKEILPMRERRGNSDAFVSPKGVGGGGGGSNLLTPIPEEPEDREHASPGSSPKGSMKKSSSQRKKWAEGQAARIRSRSSSSDGRDSSFDPDAETLRGSSSDEEDWEKIAGDERRGRSRTRREDRDSGSLVEHDVGTTSLASRDPFRDD